MRSKGLHPPLLPLESYLLCPLLNLCLSSLFWLTFDLLIPFPYFVSLSLLLPPFSCFSYLSFISHPPFFPISLFFLSHLALLSSPIAFISCLTHHFTSSLSHLICPFPLPLSHRDPNLWSVKCHIGTEKETAIILMRKFLALQFSDSVSTVKV